MTERRPIFQNWMPPARSISGLLLVSLLCWVAASAAFKDPSRCLYIALAPLIVASFRYVWIGRLLGWSGVLAQVGFLFLD